VTIRIVTSGGLGNQLFHLAVAHAYLEKFPEEKILLYWSGFKGESTSRFKLFGILNECKHSIYFQPSNTCHLFYKIVDWLGSFGIRVERFLKPFRIFDYSNPCASVIHEKVPPRLIRGYFQNVENIGNIRDSVFIKELVSHLSQKIVNNDPNTTEYDYGIHLRRGDYLENKESIGILKIDYYLLNNPLSGSVVVASDSVELLNEIRPIWPSSKLLWPSINNDWETLSRLSMSKTLIMANSTFSWWAGIICCYKGHNAIMPNPWFKSGNEVGSHLFFKEFQSQNSIFE
jgi:hypothetical protein